LFEHFLNVRRTLKLITDKLIGLHYNSQFLQAYIIGSKREGKLPKLGNGGYLILEIGRFFLLMF